ncbi:MAG: hypothetical protein QHH80_07990 [Anaerolineae bacterium]|jgi:hypothetical protein|nr:hypothetical protein [Anaerolineae bacterium]
MKKGFGPVLLALLLIALGMAVVWLDTGELKAAVSSPLSGIASAILENDPNVWAIFATLLVCEVLGALASFYVIQKAFRPNARTVLLAFIVALVNFGTLYGQYADITHVGPVHFLAFFKDGFFWFATLPALARVLGMDAADAR